MTQSIKQLIVVLAIASVIFRLAKPIALRFSTEGDFVRRRNVWLVLTVIAFLSPNFWLFTLAAIPLYAWAGRKDSNPIAFYLVLLHVIAPMAISIPVPGINELFDLGNYRLLSFCVLIPTAWRLRKSQDPERIPRLQGMDYLLLAFGALQVLLFVPPDLPTRVLLHDSPTNVLRRAVLFFVDAYFLYFAVSRFCSTRRLLLEAQAALCLSCAIIAAIATFETLRHWLLYTDMVVRWTNDVTEGFYLLRGSSLRAQASAGPSLALGYLLAIALGFWFNLQTQVQSKIYRIGTVVLFSLGLLAAYSRGPWFGALLIYMIFLAMRPRAFSRFIKAGIAASVIIGAISLSPLGEKIASVLPFLGGHVDNDNIIYRQRLASRSWELIQEHPFFGDQMAYFELDDLRQGMGLIDFVNTYVNVTLFYGFIGLFLFSTLFFSALAKTYRAARRTAISDPEFAQIGYSLAACILGTMVMLVSASFIVSYQVISYVLLAFAATYACQGRQIFKPRSR